MTAAAPRIAAIVLAAGRSLRMGADNKLLAPVKGTAMIRRVLDAVLASRADPVLVVLGHDGGAVRAALTDLSVQFVENPDFRDGLSTSLRHGLKALGDDVDGAVICLGDMPRVEPGDIDALIAAFHPDDGKAVCVPVHGSKRGNPVLWARRFFPEMLELEGDAGAKQLIQRHAGLVAEVESVSDGVLFDIDTPDALTGADGSGKQ